MTIYCQTQKHQEWSLKKKKRFFLILEATRIITVSSIYCYFFLSYYCGQRITNCSLLHHSICCKIYSYNFENGFSSTPRYQEGFVAGSTLKYVTTDHKRTAPKARIRGQRQRQPLEKWDANILATSTKAERSARSTEVGSCILQRLVMSFQYAHIMASFSQKQQ